MNKGFTLVEVMILIGIASIMMLGTMQLSEISMRSSQSTARKTLAKNGLERISMVLKKQIALGNNCNTYLLPGGAASNPLNVTAGARNPIDLLDSANTKILTHTPSQFPGSTDGSFTHTAYAKLTSTGVPNSYVAEIHDVVTLPSKTYGNNVTDNVIGTVSMTLDNSYKITGKCRDLFSDLIQLGSPSSTSSTDQVMRKNSKNEVYWDSTSNLLPQGTLCGNAHEGSSGGSFGFAVGNGCLGIRPDHGCPSGFSKLSVCDDNSDDCGTAMVFCKKN